MTLGYRISIVVIPRNRMLYLTYLEDCLSWKNKLCTNRNSSHNVTICQVTKLHLLAAMSLSCLISFNLNKSEVKKNRSQWSVPKPKRHSLNGFMCLIDCPDQSLVPKCELCMVSNDNFSTTFHNHLCKLIFSQKLTKMKSYLGYSQSRLVVVW